MLWLWSWVSFLLAPGPVTDLTARAVSDSAIVLQWTEVRSSTTAIPRYLVRYDSAGGFGLTWASRPDVLTGGCAAPIVGANATGGKPHACVMTGLTPNVEYKFQMVAYTGVLNSTAVFGPLSNVVRAKTMERVGPILVWRPGLYRDTVRGVTWITTPHWGRWQVTIRPTYGDYQGTLEDSSGAVVARAYLLLVKP